ncbi:MAG: LytTR family transcriptional regulator DNA-binding domain-containing protein [Muribaculaceae bacterium]|nr:LytTR family transcriptional regulator DNA-binding domain-containing protein [Muribaculaceae bacterium]
MNKTRYLYLNSRDEFFRVDITKIVYFESEGNYTNIFLNNKMKATICINLARMQEIINENLREAGTTFARIGKRHIVNLAYVYKIAILRQTLTLSDGENFEYNISISKDALKKLREMYIADHAVEYPHNLNKDTNDKEQ